TWPDSSTEMLQQSTSSTHSLSRAPCSAIRLWLEGCLRVCRDAESPPDQVVALQWNCEAIVEGKEILDLPRLPPGGRRDCCFALILPQDKFLLLLADSPEDCKLVLVMWYTSSCSNSCSNSTGCINY
uniref:Uncharacterized protein n=1 Tax=Esox lucius TaxID=8010 RepID=A0A3P8Z0J2_ESOLU